MSKFKELREAIKNTSPERLSKIEYQSHFLQMVGVLIVSSIFIWKGFWWILFAFIFSLGISFSQGISAYQKHKAIIQIVGKKVYDPRRDKSFSRRRDYHIKKTLGRYTWILAGILSVYLNLKYIPRTNWWENIIFSFGFLFFYIVIYFFFFYWIAKYVGRSRHD